MSKEEHNEQVKVINWCKINKVFVFSVPNGSMLKGNAMQRAIQMNSLKSEGFLNGVSDIVVLTENKALFIEMKKKKHLLKSGTLSSAGINISEFQKEFLAKVNTFGFVASKVCFGAEEAINFIKKYKDL